MTHTFPTLAIGMLLTAAVAAQGVTSPQSPPQNQGQAPTVAATLFTDASAKETAVRKALQLPSPADTVLKAVRTVVGDYEALVKRFPSSGYCDDALWRAAQLSSEAFTAFGDPKEQAASIRLLQMLTARYPSSKYAKQAPARITTLKAQVAKRDVPLPASTTETAATAAVPAARPEPPAIRTPASRVAIVKDIRRAILPDVVRVVIELDMEVAFHDERLESPSRVFVDLARARLAPTLVDQTMRFDDDGDLVRQVRIGRQPNETTRVVLDLIGISSYSVYPLYNPYRLVIDCLRPKAETTTGPVVTPVPPPRTAPPNVTLVIPVQPPVVALTKPVTPVVVKPVAPPPLLTTRRVAVMAAFLPATVPVGRDAIAQALAPPPAPPLIPVPPVPTISTTAAAEHLPPAEPARNVGGGLSIARQLGLGVSHIVIDPGHGGRDPGTTDAGDSEADLVLDVALRLEKLLTKQAGVTVTLTRRTDKFVSLQERTALANRENADLFLSIHANANTSKTVQGVETYFLNFATNMSAAAVAARENAASGQSMGELPDVVKTIALHSKIDESRDFATYVQQEMVKGLQPANKTMKDLGVKQAPFVVLIGAAMPSVLAEVSFMTNPADAKLFKKADYRQKIAESLAEGLKKYQGSLKTDPTVATQ